MNPAKTWRKWLAHWQRSHSFTLYELHVFANQLAHLLSAGVTLRDALIIFNEEARRQDQRSFYTSLIAALDRGNSLSQALQHWVPGVPQFFVSSLKAGERSGQWESVFRQLAAYYLLEDEMRRKVENALLYPVVLLTVAIAVCIFLISFVIPSLLAFSSATPETLPLATRLLLRTSGFLQTFWPLLLLLLLLFALTLRYFWGRASFRCRTEAMLYHLPLLGALVCKQEWSHFSRTLALLLDSGNEMLSSLELAAAVMGSLLLRQGIAAASQQVRLGQSLSAGLASFPYLPPGFISLLRVGENGGGLAPLLQEAAAYYDLEIRMTSEKISRLIEPILILIISLFVGWIAVSILLPMLNQWQGIGLIG
ncbi:MAG: type II secretion system F family protein [Negativicutes bacterium]|nr:type II secretion system F family protein [Negativicutes bacterium]